MHVCPRCGFAEALTVPEAAERLNVSDQTIRNWLKAGRLPGSVTVRQPGGFRYMIPVEAVRRIEEAA
jgi:excisionase family DNA binding protein